ncbi:molybdate ABC transporter substrate-binding protein [Tissierella pigra]|uniref:molybdate ABC transporter substrate-binding protein n=1 Tax=Tissierella pigra TaxID=2607614 RepID=UPI001C109086|nr:molybdate ABC transporter substrate-binding protein [Tissierella pigra]MBU5425158.1 molybdate ABC transporter substrate-binding protein [Tissierella pigra]
MKIKKFLAFMLVGIISISLLGGCSKKPAQQEQGDVEPVDQVEQQPKEQVELLISAAASLTDVLEELRETYKAMEPETTIEFTFGSSGALQAQIEEGAPVDIFMSAAQKQMKALEDADLMLNESIKTLLVNKVVLITPKDSNLDIKSFEDLTKDDVKKIAVGDPSNVPVGQYSEEIFENINIKDKVEPKLILGSDVRTVLTWVESGEVDCGIVYATDAYTSDSINIITEAPEESHKEVSYPVGVVKESKNPDRAQAFLDFLSTDESKKTFEKYGFSIK